MKESIGGGTDFVNEMWRDQFQNHNLFESVIELGADAQRALYLRFWENCEIQEIAVELRISWDSADQLIVRSLETLKEKLVARLDRQSAA